MRGAEARTKVSTALLSTEGVRRIEKSHFATVEREPSQFDDVIVASIAAI